MPEISVRQFTRDEKVDFVSVTIGQVGDVMGIVGLTLTAAQYDAFRAACLALPVLEEAHGVDMDEQDRHEAVRYAARVALQR
jgi:hypothetical protein